MVIVNKHDCLIVSLGLFENTHWDIYFFPNIYTAEV